MALRRIPPAFVQLTEIHLDRAYENPEGSMYDVECLDLAGTHPLFEDIPTFPYVGGAYDIQSGNSGNCGAGWKLTNSENNTSIYLTAINKTESGFSVGNQVSHQVVRQWSRSEERIEINAERLGALSLYCGSLPPKLFLISIRVRTALEPFPSGLLVLYVLSCYGLSGVLPASFQ